MALVIDGGLEVALPRMVPVRQKFAVTEIPNIAAEMEKIFARQAKMKGIKKGARIAVTSGSRGINSIDKIIHAIVQELKRAGASPFVVPAMGSHGGATAEGQLKILAGYGITDETMGVPVRSSMEVKKLGELKNGVPVYLDRLAAESDGIVIVNRVKPHTAFKSDYESGLLKMLAIGLGKHKGATAFHSNGIDRFGELLPQLGQVVMDNAPVLFGVAVIENAYDHPAKFEVVWKEDLIRREKELLAEAKTLMPKILLDNLHALIVHEIGKEISGSGMDPNITGRSSSPHFKKPDALKVEKIVVLNLTPASKGNACGIGVADVTTKRFVNSMDLDYTYVNAITSGLLATARIPLNMPTDKEAIQLALKTCPGVKHPETRIVWIKNTLSLERIYASEPLLPEIRKNPQLEILGEARPMNFDAEGTLVMA
ncbi:MAG TPA: lactate racemase domain-containing protein [Thermodesulfobacteriota bacterium]|nr:lactate racemase domain-containing protein [Thermodesulfobacteriota bacterium]